jgi:hypothetical protein
MLAEKLQAKRGRLMRLPALRDTRRLCQPIPPICFDVHRNTVEIRKVNINQSFQIGAILENFIMQTAAATKTIGRGGKVFRCFDLDSESESFGVFGGDCFFYGREMVTVCGE